jgi:hypothetical protein
MGGYQHENRIQSPVAVSCEQGNETSVSIKDAEALDQHSHCPEQLII